MTFDSLNAPLIDHPLAQLSREDLDLIVELVRKSGSIKDLAEIYTVSYPTMRGRLDRVIERLEGVLAGRRPDPVAELLARMVERGDLAAPAARAIRDAVRQEKGAR